MFHPQASPSPNPSLAPNTYDRTVAKRIATIQGLGHLQGLEAPAHPFLRPVRCHNRQASSHHRRIYGRKAQRIFPYLLETRRMHLRALTGVRDTSVRSRAFRMTDRWDARLHRVMLRVARCSHLRSHDCISQDHNRPLHLDSRLRPVLSSGLCRRGLLNCRLWRPRRRKASKSKSRLPWTAKCLQPDLTQQLLLL